MTIDITLYGDPRTKKNSQRLVRAGLKVIPIASRAYEDYEADCIRQIPPNCRVLDINFGVNLCCVYYTATRRRVDLVNLIEATNDILVKAGVLRDDNSRIVVAHDGSRVKYDKMNPRAEITITEVDA